MLRLVAILGASPIGSMALMDADTVWTWGTMVVASCEMELLQRDLHPYA